LGSGIRNTYKYLSYYVPGAKPVFTEDDLFKAEIPLYSFTLDQFLVDLYHLLPLPSDAENHLKAGLSTIGLPQQFSKASWREVLSYLVTSYEKKMHGSDLLKWPSYKGLEVYGSQKDTSDPQKRYMAPEKDAHLPAPPKRLASLWILLLLTTSPVKRETLMAWLGFKNRASFTNNYLKPYMNMGFVEHTIIDNPRSVDQKYILTEKGRDFLGGTL
jgi:ATP-dependent DNA helicase RecG